MSLNAPATRLWSNKNLTLTYDSIYRGLPVNASSPLVVEYLERLYSTIQKALNQHPRTLALRFDLRFPDVPGFTPDMYGSAVIGRFVDSLKSIIHHHQRKIARQGKNAHGTAVRYVWAKEYGDCKRPHYHFLLLLNWDAYRTPGYVNSSGENMATRIQAAWASALSLHYPAGLGLVHFPESAAYRLERKSGIAGLEDLFYRASYLCKARSKQYGDHGNAFGCSRN